MVGETETSQCPECQAEISVDAAVCEKCGAALAAETSGEEQEEIDPKQVPLSEVIRTLMQASRGFWLVNWINFCDGIAYFGFLALMTLFMNHDIGFSTAKTTMSLGLFSGGVTIFMALGGGAISDWLGVRRALTLAVGAVLIGRIFLVGSPHMGTLVGSTAWLSLLIMAFGEGVLQPALYAGVKEYTDKRTATMGYAFLYAIMNLGIVAGELLSPVIRKTYAERIEGVVDAPPEAGISGAFWFFILVTVVMLAVHMLFFTRKVETRDRIAPIEPKVVDKRSFGEKLKELPILDFRFQFFIFILLPVRTLFAHQFMTMPLYVNRAFPDYVGAHWEWVYLVNPLVIVIFVPLFAALTRRKRVIDMMILGTLVSALSTFCLSGGPSLAMLLTYITIWSLGEALWSSRFLEYIADIAPRNRVGIYMGIAGIPWFMAKLVTGFYAGFVVDHYVPGPKYAMEKASWTLNRLDVPPPQLDTFTAIFEHGQERVAWLATHFQVDFPPQSSGSMWTLYGAIALVSPLGLILGRRWLLKLEQQQHPAA